MLLLMPVAAILAAKAFAQAPLIRGLPPLTAIAVSPQGRLFATSGDQVIEVFRDKQWRALHRTNGEARGMAFDGEGNLYVADRSRNVLLRVTPWGAASVAAPTVAVEAVTLTADGEVYFNDGDHLCRLRPGRRKETIAGGFGPVRCLAASADGTEIFVGSERKILRAGLNGKQIREFAEVPEGGAAALAVDDLGNLYAAAAGSNHILVFDPAGKVLHKWGVPVAPATSLAFAGMDASELWAASGDAILRFRALHESARRPWELEESLEVLDPPDGAILNRHDGEVVPGGLKIQVSGRSRSGGPVRVNGKEAPVQGGKFRAGVVLRKRENRVDVAGPEGTRRQIRVIWDRTSAPRYRFSTDDNIWFLEDIARNASRYQSIFENPYLAMWRGLHRKYGTKFHHNIYYETKGFNLSQMPDKFRDEWRANSEWMRLSFHARANDPDRPYIHAPAEQILSDYRLVMREIKRFAGKEVLHPVTTVHWGETTLAAARALRREGIRTLIGYFEAPSGLPRVSYYLTAKQLRHLSGRDYWKDTREDITFVRHDIVINTVPLDEIEGHLERVAADLHQAEIMELMIHEQYFYPHYSAYEPDFRERVERAIAFVTRRGYKSVFREQF